MVARVVDTQTLVIGCVVPARVGSGVGLVTLGSKHRLAVRAGGRSQSPSRASGGER